jgi:ribosomal protein L31E
MIPRDSSTFEIVLPETTLMMHQNVNRFLWKNFFDVVMARISFVVSDRMRVRVRVKKREDGESG